MLRSVVGVMLNLFLVVININYCAYCAQMRTMTSFSYRPDGYLEKAIIGSDIKSLHYHTLSPRKIDYGCTHQYLTEISFANSVKGIAPDALSICVCLLKISVPDEWNMVIDNHRGDKNIRLFANINGKLNAIGNFEIITINQHGRDIEITENTENNKHLTYIDYTNDTGFIPGAQFRLNAIGKHCLSNPTVKQLIVNQGVSVIETCGAYDMPALEHVILPRSMRDLHFSSLPQDLAKVTIQRESDDIDFFTADMMDTISYCCPKCVVTMRNMCLYNSKK